MAEGKVSAPSRTHVMNYMSFIRGHDEQNSEAIKGGAGAPKLPPPSWIRRCLHASVCDLP